MIDWVVKKWRDLGRPEAPEPVGPFDQYRYPVFIVSVPRGKQAGHVIIGASDGVAEFVRLFPYCTDDELASVTHAFEIAFAPAIQVIPARQ